MINKMASHGRCAAALRVIGWVMVATAMIPLQANSEGANQGPYVGGQLGYNQPGDQHFELGGQSTSVVQPVEPVELPLMDNSGPAADNEYKGELLYQAVVGYSYRNGLRPEFELSYRQNDADRITNPDGTEQDASGVKLSGTSGLFNLWYDVFPSWRVHPYLGAGIGLMSLKLKNQTSNAISEGEPTVQQQTGPSVCNFQSCSGPRRADDAVLAYQLGAGVRWAMLDKVTLGIDYRYLKTGKGKFYAYKDQPETYFQGDYDAQSLLLSVHYFFAKPEPPMPPPPPEPPAVVPVAPVCADGVDNDADGLIDFPNDPGCATADDNDESNPPPPPPCKTPMPGERISLGGCGTGDVIVLRGVNFEFDRATLTANAKTILDQVAGELNAYPAIEVEVSGHTDSKGSDSYNQLLSEERAASVVTYLAEMGIDRSRMTSLGFGESKPVSDNDSDEGRELNRRVELRITAGIAGGAKAGDQSRQSTPATPAAATGDGDAAQATSTPTLQEPGDAESTELDWIPN